MCTVKLDPKVERIIEWRESLASLPNEYFFELVYIYIGLVQTPYSKQKLIEQFGSILRQKENRNTIIKFLDETDIRVLSAVRFIPEPDVKKLSDFFVPGISEGDFLTEIASLEERLIIFPKFDKDREKEILCINPHLEDELEPLLKTSCLVSSEEECIPWNTRECSPVFSPSLFGAFISFVFSHPDMCKATGELKRKVSSDLKEIFKTEDISIFQVLFNSMRNLSLVRERENAKGFDIDWQRLESFSALSHADQVSYICAASAGHFSRSTLQNNAFLFQATISEMQDRFFECEKVFALSFLIKEKNGGRDVFAESRLSRIFSRTQDGQDSSITSSMMELMTDCAITLGLMQCARKNGDDRRDIVCVNRMFLDQMVVPSTRGTLSIDAAFAANLMPGLSLAQMIPLIKMMDIKGFDVISTWEFSRQSVCRALGLGFTRQSLEDTLDSYCSFKLPQNLAVSFDDWDNSFNSVKACFGFVLKLSREKTLVAENNPAFMAHVKEVLAPGVFFLDLENEGEVRALLLKAGTDFTGRIETAGRQVTVQNFRPLSRGMNTFLDFDESGDMAVESECSTDDRTSEQIISTLKDELERLDVTPDQKDGLLDRIERKIVLSPQQLRPESVKFELMEAYGMNFTGKMHVLESAIQKENLVELEMTGTKEVILGSPRALVKNSENPVVFVICRGEDDSTTQEIEVQVARISHVRRIRKAVRLSNL